MFSHKLTARLASLLGGASSTHLQQAAEVDTAPVLAAVLVDETLQQGHFPPEVLSLEGCLSTTAS